jgi:hypothetical protein
MAKTSLLHIEDGSSILSLPNYYLVFIILILLNININIIIGFPFQYNHKYD